MLTRVLAIAAAILAAAVALAADDKPDLNPQTGAAARKAIREMEAKGWTLALHDEFDGSALDTTHWIDSYPNNVRTHGNNEQQYYATDGYGLEKGVLKLRAERRPMGGMPYTSGMVTSYGNFSQKFGWFEIRCRMPKGKGMWPAFWLLPDDRTWPPEIDVLEVLGHETQKVYLTNHYKNSRGRHEGKGGYFTGPDFAAGFHTFAVDWEPDAIVWYVDGVERYRTDQNIPAVPMYVLANLAVGGDWPGNPDETTPFPNTMDIDYIRVYKKNGSAKAARPALPATKETPVLYARPGERDSEGIARPAPEADK
ncbi:MAG TPA: glycoside hydrolase family 16 protein [Chthonomonadaceae bacterium]|nr:glycoside hydrolase family 16 protein [Chthonomonadaceae bacterium]